MKKALRIPAIILYIIATTVLGIYLFADLNPRIMMVPASRIILLGAICIASYFASLLYAKTVTQETKNKLVRGTFIFYFVLYIFLLLTFVLFDSFFGRAHMGMIWNCDPFYLENFLSDSINIIPFKTVFEYIASFFDHTIPIHTIIVNIFGNILAFVPFGFFAPIIFKIKPSILKFILLMAAASLIIECTQLIFLVGSCDIDDVILNTLGSVLSYLFFRSKNGKVLITFLTRSQ